MKIRRSLLLSILLSTVHITQAQFSLDHYQNPALMASEKIDMCSISVLSPDGSQTIEQSFIYNKDGAEIENRRDFQDFSYIYMYDSSGRKTAAYMAPFGESYYERDTLIYDDEGRHIKTITYDGAGNETKRNEYDYNHNQIVEERYIYDSVVQTKSFFEYDEKNRIQKTEIYFRGKKDEEWKYEYDEKGQLITFTSLTAEGAIALVNRFEYNEKGLRVKQSIYANGNTLSDVFLSTYDDKGLLVSMTEMTEIKNNDPMTGLMVETIYRYSYRR